LGPYDVPERAPPTPTELVSLPTRATIRYRRSGFGIVSRRGGSLCCFPMPSSSRPFRPPPGRVGSEEPSAGIRAVPDGAPLLVGDPIGRRTSLAFGLAGSEEPSPPWRSTPCLPGPPSRVVPPCRRHRHRLRGTDASGFGRATLPTAPWSKSVAASQENHLRGPEPGSDHRPPTRRPTDRDLATHSGSKTSLGHDPEPRAEAQSPFRGTRSRRPKTPQTGPDRSATHRAPPSDPPARLRSEPAFRAARPPRRALDIGPLIPPGRNPSLLRPLSASEEAGRTRERPFRPRRTRRPASEAERP